ncbi:hypothetical protein CBR_g19216 [Chara braunii]|uniref:AAA+ ATPase domain-containing protein n=1 Tax=Chara braunii TaxID=69332 RepID=A0A388JTM2_CHABU|nr:hypothetical protein CBR_g19216 [Chara braunii]|eukprot:GBG61140.1 hypothetical protein CBR_g19216 [Chara braunii]
MDKAFLLVLAVAAGLAAGTAAGLAASAFPYALGTAIMTYRSKRKKGESRELKHRHKGEKLKKSSPGSLSKEGIAYREELRRRVIDWKDIDVTFDDFPYFLSESFKELLIDSAYIILKKPDYLKYTTDLGTLSPRILLVGPSGTEIFQEMSVRALAGFLESNLLIFDSTAITLDVCNNLELSETASFQEQEESVVEKPSSVEGHSLPSGNSLMDVKEAASMTRPEIRSNRDTARHSPSMKLPQMDDADGVSSLTHCEHHQQTTRSKGTSSPGKTQHSSPQVVVGPPKRSLKKGDRVKYVGNGGLSGSSSAFSGPSSEVMDGLRSSSAFSRGPQMGSKGRVMMVVEENRSKVGVRFDKPVCGGHSLADLCEEGHGFFCNVSDLRLEGSANEDADKVIAEALLEVVMSEAAKGPLILYIRNVEKLFVGNFDRYVKLERLEKNQARVVVFGSHTSESRKDKDHFGSRLDDPKGELSKTTKFLYKLFPTRISVQPPQDERALEEWNKKLEKDTEILRAEHNRQRIRLVLSHIAVPNEELESLCIDSHLLTVDTAEKAVGLAASRYLRTSSEALERNGKLVIDGASLQQTVRLLQDTQKGVASSRKGLKDIVPDNEFEKLLLAEVIPPYEIGVNFEHIGALENVKETLRELVMLPLQRPELFAKGQLTKPCRGLLLFGPPGTGKTMLAKAVATEAGANFINISMSTIASKWFGEAEKYVKAVFTLASKIAPCVIFIDEVDSMLGRRGKDNEHAAMRKIKNEFMSSWDGLRTRENERILVLAATNRPFDLDEAVIRRFPRRLLVDVPDAENRAKILKVILAEEELEEGFNIEELAAATDGYTGSDLKNLCTTAAYRRIREILENEKKERVKAEAEGRPPPARQPGSTPFIRSLTMEDMKQAMEKVRSSVSTDGSFALELQQWNEQYGEEERGGRLFAAVSSVRRKASSLKARPGEEGGSRLFAAVSSVHSKASSLKARRGEEERGGRLFVGERKQYHMVEEAPCQTHKDKGVAKVSSVRSNVPLLSTPGKEGKGQQWLLHRALCLPPALSPLIGLDWWWWWCSVECELEASCCSLKRGTLDIGSCRRLFAMIF